MGDIADMMLEGFMCEVCGEVIDDEEPGYPRRCPGCEDDLEKHLIKEHDTKRGIKNGN